MAEEPLPVEVKIEKGQDKTWTLGDQKYTREDIKACFDDKQIFN